jgi:CubicO group peptidase (beta-lactamase class C family)
MSHEERPKTAQQLGLMQGFPPPEDRLVTLANWQDAPYNRWGFLHVSHILPTAQISRGEGPVAALPRSHWDLGGITFDRTGGRMTIAQMLEGTYTDGFIVLKDGAIVAEKYFNGMAPHTRHLLMSVSKSLTGALAGILAEQGLLDLTAPVRTYVPELGDSGYGDATVRQVLDMTVSLVFREEYDDPRSEIQQQDRATGWRPSREGDIIGNYHFLPTIKKDGEHGRVFQYCSATTDVLGWVLEKVSGVPFPELFSREIWAQLGAEHDGYITVDQYGASLPNGGFCLTLRDLARFGQMILQDGHFNGRSIVPSSSIDETRNRGDNGPWSYHPTWSQLYPRGNYHNQWYNAEDAHRSFFGIGIHGQHLWIDPTANVVIVTFSTRPSALDAAMRSNTLAGLAAIGHALG